MGIVEGMSNTALAHTIEIVAPTFELPELAPANDVGDDPVATWLALRAESLKARVLERIEIVNGRYHHTAEVRLGSPDDERPVYRLAVTLCLRVDGGTKEDLRELVRGWCNARGVRRRGWVPGKQSALSKAKAERAMRVRGLA